MSTLRLAGGCLMFSLFAGCVSIPAPASADVGISFDFFYSDLSPHGDWLVSASYGRVWQPAGYGTGWNPYYDGHWIYTDVGWTWVSDYEWGAVPYHYGTWVVDAELGWVWVPGYVWAPAWVVFRTGPDYIGWAPVPVDYSVGMSIGSAPYSPELFVFVASRGRVVRARAEGGAGTARDPGRSASGRGGNRDSSARRRSDLRKGVRRRRRTRQKGQGASPHRAGSRQGAAAPTLLSQRRPADATGRGQTAGDRRPRAGPGPGPGAAGPSRSTGSCGPAQ